MIKNHQVAIKALADIHLQGDEFTERLEVVAEGAAGAPGSIGDGAQMPTEQGDDASDSFGFPGEAPGEAPGKLIRIFPDILPDILPSQVLFFCFSSLCFGRIHPF